MKLAVFTTSNKVNNHCVRCIFNVECVLVSLQEGDFLVRESQGSQGQYVLTGMQSGHHKHLLLVDPEGVVSAATNPNDE